MSKLATTNPECPFCNNQSIRWGARICRHRTIQRYLCKTCNRYFTLQSPQQLSKTYSLKTILDTISEYNLGTPLRKITNQKGPIPSSTIHDWTKTINLPMNRLRNKLKGIPAYEIIKKQRFIHHKQPFLYQYHKIKLEFAKKYPYLIRYLTNLKTSLPKDIFRSSKRISEVSKEMPKQSKNEDENVITKQNYAVELAKLAVSITKDNKQRHNIIENFMLINDTSTIAVELPVYLNKEESPTHESLTGHIDILQIRYNKFYILDYKPPPINKQQTITQLRLYRKALSALTGITHFRAAYFNENRYYEVS